MDHNPSTGENVSSGARLIPRITIQAFCEHSQTAQLVELVVHDRRMSKVALTTHNGGVEGAIETYKSNPTPNLIIIETDKSSTSLPADLERLSGVCDAETRVVVLGHVNDIVLYRELMKFGVSDYLVLPTEPHDIVSAITEIFNSENAAPIGRTIGFISAKGGAGASTVAHNTAWSLAQIVRQDVLVVDMDLPFGTAGLNFNQDPPHGLADAVFSSETLDAVMLDRLMSKAAAHINLLAAPVTLERPYDFDEMQFEQIIELAQKTIPLVVLDIPHAWNAWVRHTIAQLDEIVIVAEPDLANLRNAKSIADAVKTLRPSENDPYLVVNNIGVPKRPEISPTEFAASVECQLIGKISFDPMTFGTAANNGQMIDEVQSGHKANDVFKAVAHEVSGRASHELTGKSSGLKIPAGLSKLLKIG